MSAAKAEPGAVDPAEVATLLRALLAKVETGEMFGTATMVARLEGAAIALESLTWTSPPSDSPTSPSSDSPTSLPHQ